MADQIKDPKAPMASAPMVYNDDGSVAWGNMWDNYCVLATEGGPPHRGTMLLADEKENIDSEGYQFALSEIKRGIKAVSGLDAQPGPPGWIAMNSHSAGHAFWLVEAITEENVEARRDGPDVLLPVGEHFTIKGEIKNVITAVAKTTHYWVEHVPAEVKQTSEVQARLNDTKDRVKGFFRKLGLSK